MRPTKGWGYVVASILAAAAVTLSTSAAWADEPLLSFPAGTACTFALDVFGTPGNNAIRHDANGVIISGGTGFALTFSGNGNTVSFPSNGAVTITKTNPDGSQRLELSGHNVVFLFPTDKPAGPSTLLIVGHAVIDVDKAGNFNVVSISGAQTDICAALS